MLQKSSIIDVMAVFFDEPTKQHYLLEISRKAGLAHTSTKSHLEELKREGIISEIIERKGSRDFPVFLANIQGKGYKSEKRIFNQVRIIESGLISWIRE
jgi:hypothetical protein